MSNAPAADPVGAVPAAPSVGVSTSGASRTALAGIKVLDLSGLAGQYCGKQFADLGADVILVEPLAGSSVRRDGPFLDDKAHIEFSLPFTYFNAGKRGIALDLERSEGQRIFRRLARNADLVIET
jgi:benzylsuccinate CoA-transferase BbsE subunit